MTIHRRPNDPVIRQVPLSDEKPAFLPFPKMPPQVRERQQEYTEKYIRYLKGDRDIVFGQAHTLKCLECNLHFVVLTMQSFWIDRNQGFCPECGGSELFELGVRLLRSPIDHFPGESTP